MPGETPITTAEGPAAVEEAIEYLKNAQPLNALEWVQGLSKSCQDHVADQAPEGATGHDGSDGSSPFDRMDRHGEWKITAAENLAYGSDTGTTVIMSLFVDDDVPDRGHRVALFNEDLGVTGIYSGPHKIFRGMTCINYAGDFENSATPTQAAEVPDPSTWNTNSQTLTKPDGVSDLDWSIYEATNRLRSDPTSFIPFLENQLQYFDNDKTLWLPLKNGLITREGPPAWREAIEYLRTAETLGYLEWKPGMARACQDHVLDQGPRGAVSHLGTDGSNNG